MHALSTFPALMALAGMALTACSASPSGGDPQSAEYAARAVETAVNQELTDYLASPDQRDALTGLLFGDQQTTSLRDSIIKAANAAAEQSPGATATVKDFSGEGMTAVPTAFEVTAAGSPTWCVAVQQSAWTNLVTNIIDGSAPTPLEPGGIFALYKATAGDCAAALKLYEDDLASQTAKADLAVAQSDGAVLAKQITMLLIDTTNMGTTPANTTTWASIDEATGTLTLTPGAGAEGIVTTASVYITPGTTIVSSGMAGGSPSPASGPVWCIAVDHNGQVATYTEAGLQRGKISCTVDGIAVGPASDDLDIAN